MPAHTAQINEDKRAYLIGIKGVGMTALARLLQARGWHVEGSDTHERFFTDAVLSRHGIPLHEGFTARHVPQDAALYVASSAYGKSNAEVAAVRKLKKPLRTYAEALGELFNAAHGIAVCGSHGKTTTSALLGWVFKKAGLEPTVVVGSEVPQFGGNAISGSGKYFIAETDEYQNKLRYFAPHTVLLTNIDYDHPDYFKTRAAYRNAFRKFIHRIPRSGALVAYADDIEIQRIVPAVHCRIIWYGLEQADPSPVRAQLPRGSEKGGSKTRWTARDIKVRNGLWQFKAVNNGKIFGRFTIQLPGRHNVLNALGAIAVAHSYGIGRPALLKALATFKGTRRRFERVGTYKGAVVIDDYAHHPTEIRASLAAARELWPRKRIVAVFHPHTYSRTKALLKEFAGAFNDADELLLLDIYASAREKKGGVTGADLVRAARARHGNVKFSRTMRKAEAHLRMHLGRGDILITFGAGDVWKMGRSLTARYQ